MLCEVYRQIHRPYSEGGQCTHLLLHVGVICLSAPDSAALMVWLMEDINTRAPSAIWGHALGQLCQGALGDDPPERVELKWAGMLPC
jgi:hypothetical protein